MSIFGQSLFIILPACIEVELNILLLSPMGSGGNIIVTG